MNTSPSNRWAVGAARATTPVAMGLLLLFMVAIVARPTWLWSADGKTGWLTWLLLGLAALWLALVGAVWRKADRSRASLRLPSGAADAIVLAGLFLVSLAVRVPMTRHALPYQDVWDEVTIYKPAMRMLTTPGLKPEAEVPGYGKAGYGDLLAYVTAAGQVIGLLDGMRTRTVYSWRDYVSPPVGVPSIDQGVHVSGNPLRYPRLLFSAINSLMPVLVFLLLRRHFGIGRWAAAAAALLLAILSRDVLYYSSFILPDAFGTTLTLGVTLAALRGMEDPAGRRRHWVVAGLLTGMVLSVTVRLLMVPLIPAAALALSRNRERVWLRAACGIAAVAAGFVLTSPYAVLDLPGQLEKLTSLSWGQDRSLEHRLSSLTFYLGGMFKPGFHSPYVDSAQGSVGLGVPAGLLAWLGLWRIARRHPRQAAVLLLFAIAHLWLILPVVERYTRHALVLYPLVCVLAGIGLGEVTDALKGAVRAGRSGRAAAQWQSLTPLLVFALFVAAHAIPLRLTLDYMQRFSTCTPSQVQAAAFLRDAIKPGDRIGILDAIPWVEYDGIARTLPSVRIRADASVSDLRATGITHVVGASLRGQYAGGAKPGWPLQIDPRRHLAEFGEADLAYAGYPCANLKLFVAALPAAPAGLAGP